MVTYRDPLCVKFTDCRIPRETGNLENEYGNGNVINMKIIDFFFLIESFWNFTNSAPECCYIDAYYINDNNEALV